SALLSHGHRLARAERRDRAPRPETIAVRAGDAGPGGAVGRPGIDDSVAQKPRAGERQGGSAGTGTESDRGTATSVRVADAASRARRAQSQSTQSVSQPGEPRLAARDPTQPEELQPGPAGAHPRTPFVLQPQSTKQRVERHHRDGSVGINGVIADLWRRDGS